MIDMFWKAAVLGIVQGITEFQNFSRESGLLMRTVMYWEKLTLSGMNFRFTMLEI